MFAGTTLGRNGGEDRDYLPAWKFPTVGLLLEWCGCREEVLAMLKCEQSL
jgi:hypothetical protein